MSRLFVYDENMLDERAKITVAKMAAISDIVAPDKAYIQYSGRGEITVIGGCVIAVGETSVFKTAETILTKENLDQGSDFAHGNDPRARTARDGTMPTPGRLADSIMAV